MMRSLWTGATGMLAQQTAIDTISNNISNVNTAGFKKNTVEFKSLLYSKIQTKQEDHEGNRLPTVAQVGAGARVAGTTTRFEQGATTETGNSFDFAISGKGFFQIRIDEENVAYTRAGNFNVSLGGDGTLVLATQEGYPVLSSNGEPIAFDGNIISSDIFADENGFFYLRNADETITDLNIRFGLVQFNNPAGLEKIGNTTFAATDASGEARFETEEATLERSVVYSGRIEASNVQTVDEMVNLIVAQRAYELNSKIITASDEMLQTANNLKTV